MKNFVFLAAILFSLSACSGVEREAKYPTGVDRNTKADANDIYSDSDSIFGEEGFALFGGKGEEDDGSGASGIGVNSYLWRASLDTVSFMPLASADPFGGVIITDWYSPPEKSNERFKINVFILDKQLRSDGLSVKVFRQMNRGGRWADEAVAPETARQLEDAILTRARQMRVAKLGN